MNYLFHISPDLQPKAEALGLEYEIHADWIGPKWEFYTANSDINVIYYHSEFGTL